MRSLVVEKSVARFAAARLASSFGSGRGAGIGPLRLVDGETPVLPASGWHLVAPRLSGICGSDLATLDGRSSRYFEEYVSFPFVPGHEVVGTLSTDATSATGVAIPAGSRVVIEPVLACRTRGIEPLCLPCAEGRTGECAQVSFGHLHPGLQTGYCSDTGGGWSEAGLVAHDSQLHLVPEHLSDTEAVIIEPLACAIHAAMAGRIRDGETVAVIGAGTLGLLTVGALSHLAGTGRIPRPGRLLVGARYAHQRRLACELGADDAILPQQLPRAVRLAQRTMAVGGPTSAPIRLAGGADVVFDCVGSPDSLAASLTMVRHGGRVVLVGMAGPGKIDLAPLWHRGITLLGAYAYGTEEGAGTSAPVRTFTLAIEAVTALQSGRLVSATYPLDRFEEAIAHAGTAGRRGSVKVAFDLSESSLPPIENRPSPVRRTRKEGR